MLSDFRNDDKKPNAYPLHLIRCLDCNFCQLTDTAPFNEMYTENYGFKSGTNEVIRADLRDIVDHAVRTVGGLKDGDLWLSIGENDGTLLSYAPDCAIKVGVDPITKLCEEQKEHADIVINDFFSQKVYEERVTEEVLSNLPKRNNTEILPRPE